MMVESAAQLSRRAVHARLRWAAMAVTGLAAAAVTGMSGAWLYAPAAGWAVAALVYNVWVWLAIGPLDNVATQAHAVQEDPRRATAELLILVASLGSLAAVVVVMVSGAGASHGERLLLAGLALGTTAMSWLLVHTLFTLRYAEIYYTGPEPGGISFNQDELPQYTDFAYMSFSLGMTYQVSDTNIETRQMRSAALRHSLLAFVFGTGILATTINLVVSLAQ
jgi:uncharacterized membrane protein